MFAVRVEEAERVEHKWAQGWIVLLLQHRRLWPLECPRSLWLSVRYSYSTVIHGIRGAHLTVGKVNASQVMIASLALQV
jgi:hypothetical protein